MPDAMVSHSTMVSQIEAACRAEAEACAKIAEEQERRWAHLEMNGRRDFYACGYEDCATFIAAKIRQRYPEPESRT